MKKIFHILILLGLIFQVSLVWALTNEDQQQIQMIIHPINVLVATPNNVVLEIQDVDSNTMEILPATNDLTKYHVVTNGTNKKIVGRINSDMPENTALKVQLAAPSGAQSQGLVTLSSTTQNLVTGITGLVAVNNSIHYEFSASPSVAPQTINRTVTLTLTDGQ